ncbi:hypothetical protein PN36_19625 [Candidatus Thiomargarita nelsonii]|uniref:Antitoxin n=1 Tax=Candidatus Thiomargarita nelsonii TaxID=1003181 RepID=A0A4E0QP95_9GAMM|nr:hypothetical protein PN36_19625 [Candidatus Thiomargarita nelsonii]
MHSVSVEEAKSNFSNILNKVETGEEFVITRYAIPVARISAIKRELKQVPSKASLRATLPFSETPSVELIRQMRDGEY